MGFRKKVYWAGCQDPRKCMARFCLTWEESASTRPCTFFLLTARSLGKGYFWCLPLGHGIVHLPILTCVCPSPRTSLLWTTSLQIPTGSGKLLGSKVSLTASWWRNGVFVTKISSTQLEFILIVVSSMYRMWKRLNYLFHCPFGLETLCNGLSFMIIRMLVKS